MLSLQWMLPVCLAIWCGSFLFLSFGLNDLPLIGLLLIALAAYFIAYSVWPITDAITLLAGATLGKGAGLLLKAESGMQDPPSLRSSAARAEIGNESGADERVALRPWLSHRMGEGGYFLVGLALLLAFASLWHVDMSGNLYPRLRRMGLWNNPNDYGMLMGTGLVLAIGLLSGRQKAEGRGQKPANGKWNPLLRSLHSLAAKSVSYYSLAFIDLALDINDEERLLLDHYEKLAEARYQQGAGLQQAAVKLQAEITRVQSRLEELKSRRVDAEASLNTLMNRPAETPVARIKLPPVPAVDIDYRQLYQVGRRNRPEVLASLLEIERDEKRIDLARKDYWPSFSVGGTFVNVLARPVAPGAMAPDSNGMNVWSVNLGISLPLHRSKYDAEVAEATEAKVASTHGYQATVNAVESSIRDVGFHIGTLREQMTLFNTTLVPQTQQSLQSAEAAYSTGSLGVLDLLDSERVLLDVRLGLAQLITDYMKSLADMERALGSPFPEVKP